MAVGGGIDRFAGLALRVCFLTGPARGLQHQAHASRNSDPQAPSPTGRRCPFPPSPPLADRHSSMCAPSVSRSMLAVAGAGSDGARDAGHVGCSDTSAASDCGECRVQVAILRWGVTAPMYPVTSARHCLTPLPSHRYTHMLSTLSSFPPHSPGSRQVCRRRAQPAGAQARGQEAQGKKSSLRMSPSSSSPRLPQSRTTRSISTTSSSPPARRATATARARPPRR
ncbi:hypothetical protein JB92DRAFT_986255 [Gautieria morchelliformis]|nr:hypothetical protein JB92DRAFT_986255 [Gautieria morchelliformis]